MDKAIRALEDREEALTVVDVAVQFAVKAIAANVDLPMVDFERWFDMTGEAGVLVSA